MRLSEPLRRHPVLAAEWLQLRARLQRSWLLIVAAVSGAVVLMFTLVAFVDADRHILAAAASWPIVATLAGLAAMGLVAKRTRRLRNVAVRSWLAAAPVAQRDRWIALGIRVTWPLAAILGSASLLAMLAPKGESALAAGQTLLASLWAGAACGVGVGSVLANTSQRSRYEASRYTPRSAQATALAPSPRALSHWPIAQAFAWARPENLRAVIAIVLLLAVQAGTSAWRGLLIVAAWLLGGYLVGLLAAVPEVAHAAARWLRSTPWPPQQFARTIAARALVHQIVGLLVVALAISALGSPAHMTFALCALWVGVIATVYGAGFVRALR